MPPALQAVEPPLGPQPNNTNFYHPREVTLAMKEKVLSLSGDDFTVRTVGEKLPPTSNLGSEKKPIQQTKD